MRSNISLSRAPVAAVLLATLVGTAGCSWFHKTDDLYVQASENRPLEVPPDLDLPNTQGAVGVPAGSVTASGTVAAASGASSASTASAANATRGFNVAGSRDEVFAKVDAALEGIEGVSVASRAQLLGVFDVNYQDVNFLVRVSEVDAGTYISAVDPRGMPASGAAPTQLIEQLKATLGGN